MRSVLFSSIAALAISNASCNGNVLSTPQPAEPEKPAQSEKQIDSPFNKEFLKAAAEYKPWGRVDDKLSWAPSACAAPGGPAFYPPPQPQFSASKDEVTHGQKLYSLFAKNRNDYLGIAKSKTAAVGQIIVKQSWVPEEITDVKKQPAKRIDPQEIIRTPNSEAPDLPTLKGDHFYPYVRKGEKVFKASKQGDLFVMMKLDPKTPGTDEGWVYATLSPDGKKLTSAGMVESCMKCHQETKTDRLFGLGK